MSRMPSVNVVLATYNGERYIENLINSILSQDYTNFKICVRDDCSSDKTAEIVKNLAKKNPRIIVLESKENLGVPNSFYQILRECDDADYYAFADQDDLWETNKLTRAVEVLEKLDPGKANMYCSSFGYYDEHESFIRKFDLADNVNIYNSIYYTPSLGFTLVFNEKLRELGLKGTEKRSREEHGELHDRRFIRVGVTFGSVICDQEMTAKHIRHESAVTNADSSNHSLLKGWIRNELLGNDMLIQQKGLKNYIEDYEDELANSDKRVISLFANKGHRFRKIFYLHRLRQRISGEILLRILFLFGKA